MSTMDPETLAAVCAMGETMSGPIAHGFKREAPEGDGDGDSGEEGDEGPANKKTKGNEAARAKANREKARREKLNDRCAPLDRDAEWLIGSVRAPLGTVAMGRGATMRPM